MLIEGGSLGHGRRTALAAALLAERDPFRRANPSMRAPSESDLLDRVEVLETFERDGTYETPLGELDRGAGRFVLRARDQLAQMLDTDLVANGVESDQAVMRAVLAAFPDRVCRRRNPGGRKGIMVGGRGVRLDNRSAVTRPSLFVAVDVEAGQEETLVRVASGIEREWLPATLVSSGVETGFDSASGRVQAWKRTRYLDLVLEESPTVAPEGEAAQAALAGAARAQFAEIRPTADSPAGQFRTRVRWLRGYRPQLELPAFDDAELLQLLDMFASSCRSLGELKKADWLGAMQGRLTREQLLAVEREAPDRIAVPSGSSVALTYEEGRPPILAVRIQELFGLQDTPRIAGGTVPVLLHLLAPNYRPQQVTEDLASFWRNTYPVVRKELRVRYPKHAWPEDPLTAPPQKKPSGKR
jgi:ATP-dependent helicase HrpB